MRIVVVVIAGLVIALSTTADAEPVAPRLTWILGGAGAGRVDDVPGMAVGWSMELGVVHANTVVGLEVGMGWICPLDGDDCHGTVDEMVGLHARQRLFGSPAGERRFARLWWFGGGIVAHWIKRFPKEYDVIEDVAGHWEPGVDLQIVYELRAREEPWFGMHLGLRTFLIRDDTEAKMTKPMTRSPLTGYGIDGGVVLELGYIYGR